MDATKRFSNRVADYVKYRPDYPKEIIRYLEDNFGLDAGQSVADIGAGTGISAALFLEKGLAVYAVEPNEEMLKAGRTYLQKFEGISFVNGTAENTNLQPHVADWVVSAQAFHWFDRVACKKEFKRILSPGGFVALIWNERLANTSFGKDYDALLQQHAIDYVTVDHRQIDLKSIKEFFGNGFCDCRSFSNHQDMDFESLTGRVASSSYMPEPGTTGFDQLSIDLKSLFDQYQKNDVVRIQYETKVYVGHLDEAC